jgi:hypothetical protein
MKRLNAPTLARVVGPFRQLSKLAYLDNMLLLQDIISGSNVLFDVVFMLALRYETHITAYSPSQNRLRRSVMSLLSDNFDDFLFPKSTIGLDNSISVGWIQIAKRRDCLDKKCSNDYITLDFPKSHNILPTQLYAWNPVLGLNVADCSSKFWASEFYCIGATATVPVAAPGPTQTGITAGCNKYAQAVEKDTCSVFGSRDSTSTVQLSAGNRVLSTDGHNCQTSVWTGEWYCTGIVSGALAITTTSSTSKTSPYATAPGPTQIGISSNCIAFAQAISSDGCDSYAKGNGIINSNLCT